MYNPNRYLLNMYLYLVYILLGLYCFMILASYDLHTYKKCDSYMVIPFFTNRFQMVMDQSMRHCVVLNFHQSYQQLQKLFICAFLLMKHLMNLGSELLITSLDHQYFMNQVCHQLNSTSL